MHYDMEIDLHGKKPEEAVSFLEEMIFANESKSILIIHGKGDGVLRKKVREFLDENEYIKMIRPGETNNIPGGEGVTVIYT